MQARHRKTILLAVLAGVVAFVILDSAPDRNTKSAFTPAQRQGQVAGDGTALPPNLKPAARSLVLELPERSSFGESAGDLFVSRSWQPPPPKVAAVPPKPVAPPMPYRFAGKLMQNGELQIFLSKGDTPVSIKQGEILEGNYRVESITDERVTLVYVPLGQSTIIPVSSAISTGTPANNPFGAVSLPGTAQPAVASTSRVPFPPPQAAGTASAASETKLPPLLWEGSRQGK